MDTFIFFEKTFKKYRPPYQMRGLGICKRRYRSRVSERERSMASPWIAALFSLNSNVQMDQMLPNQRATKWGSIGDNLKANLFGASVYFHTILAISFHLFHAQHNHELQHHGNWIMTNCNSSAEQLSQSTGWLCIGWKIQLKVQPTSDRLQTTI